MCGRTRLLYRWVFLRTNYPGSVNRFLLQFALERVACQAVLDFEQQPYLLLHCKQHSPAGRVDSGMGGVATKGLVAVALAGVRDSGEDLPQLVLLLIKFESSLLSTWLIQECLQS